LGLGHRPPGKAPPGQKRWEFFTAGGPTSPTIGPDGTVYLGSGDYRGDIYGHVYALDAPTGQRKWEFATVGSVSSPPAIWVDGTVFVASWQGVYAIDGTSGQQRWALLNHRRFYASPALGADGTVYVGTEEFYTNSVYALDGLTGATKWECRISGGQFGMLRDPVVGADGTIYLGSFEGKVYAINGATGNLLWQAQSMGAPCLAVESDGTLIVGSTGGDTVSALDGTTGQKKWEFVTGYWQYSTPAIGSDGTVYVFRNGFDNEYRCFALDGAAGKLKWDFLSGILVFNSPAIGTDGTIYVGGNGGVFALNPVTGAKNWTFAGLPKASYSSPAIGIDGTIFITASDSLSGTNVVYALAGDYTNQLATSSWPMFHRNARNTGQMPAAPRTGNSVDSGVMLEGTTTNLSVLVGGEPLPTFQWIFNDFPISGATNLIYQIPSISLTNAGTYLLVASNALGAVTNPPATFGVNNVVASNFVGLVLHAAPGTPLQLQAADHLTAPVNWRRLADLTVPTNPYAFIDVTASNIGQRFYRSTQQDPLEAGLFPGWSLTAPAGTRQRIEYVDAQVGFTNWQFLTNLTLSSTPYLFIDTAATNKLPRFYRTSLIP
jgi:outer membrane protein assembly factor BamB